jgi:hypothetical protein
MSRTNVKTVTDSYPELISLAVHEFRTPASVVGGYLRMLRRDTESLSERQRKMIDEAEKSCVRLVALIAELSELSKIDAGQITLGRQSLDVFTLVGEVAELVHEAKDREVLLEVRGQKDGASMTGDAARLRTAFDAIFRAILREKAGPATVIAERRVEMRDGRSAAVLVVAEPTRPVRREARRHGLGAAACTASHRRPRRRDLVAGRGRRERPAGARVCDRGIADRLKRVSRPAVERCSVEETICRHRG